MQKQHKIKELKMTVTLPKTVEQDVVEPGFATLSKVIEGLNNMGIDSTALVTARNVDDAKETGRSI